MRIKSLKRICKTGKVNLAYFIEKPDIKKN